MIQFDTPTSRFEGSDLHQMHPTGTFEHVESGQKDKNAHSKIGRNSQSQWPSLDNAPYSDHINDTFGADWTKFWIGSL